MLQPKQNLLQFSEKHRTSRILLHLAKKNQLIDIDKEIIFKFADNYIEKLFYYFTNHQDLKIQSENIQKFLRECAILAPKYYIPTINNFFYTFDEEGISKENFVKGLHPDEITNYEISHIRSQQIIQEAIFSIARVLQNVIDSQRTYNVCVNLLKNSNQYIFDPERYFDIIDCEHNGGYLSIECINIFMRNCGYPLSEKQIRGLIRLVSNNEEGLKKQDFINLLSGNFQYNKNYIQEPLGQIPFEVGPEKQYEKQELNLNQQQIPIKSTPLKKKEENESYYDQLQTEKPEYKKKELHQDYISTTITKKSNTCYTSSNKQESPEQVSVSQQLYSQNGPISEFKLNTPYSQANLQQQLNENKKIELNNNQQSLNCRYNRIDSQQTLQEQFLVFLREVIEQEKKIEDQKLILCRQQDFTLINAFEYLVDNRNLAQIPFKNLKYLLQNSDKIKGFQRQQRLFQLFLKKFSECNLTYRNFVDLVQPNYKSEALILNNKGYYQEYKISNETAQQLLQLLEILADNELALDEKRNILKYKNLNEFVFISQLLENDGQVFSKYFLGKSLPEVNQQLLPQNWFDLLLQRFDKQQLGKLTLKDIIDDIKYNYRTY